MTTATHRQQSPDYNRLPRNARLRARHVCELTGLSVATVWRRANDPKSGFPKPRRDGCITSWSYGEVADYLEAQA